jgi:hypothetical protein
MAKKTGNFTVYDTKNNQGIFVKTDGKIKTYQLKDTANGKSMVDLPSGTKLSEPLYTKTGVEMLRRLINQKELSPLDPSPSEYIEEIEIFISPPLSNPNEIAQIKLSGINLKGVQLDHNVNGLLEKPVNLPNNGKNGREIV